MSNLVTCGFAVYLFGRGEGMRGGREEGVRGEGIWRMLIIFRGRGEGGRGSWDEYDPFRLSGFEAFASTIILNFKYCLCSKAS